MLLPRLVGCLLLWTTVVQSTDQPPPRQQSLPERCVNDGVYQRLGEKNGRWWITDPRYYAGPLHWTDELNVDAYLKGHQLTPQEQHALRREVDAFWRGYHSIVRLGWPKPELSSSFERRCLKFLQEGLEKGASMSAQETREFVFGYNLWIANYNDELVISPHKARRREGFQFAQREAKGKLFHGCYLDGVLLGPDATRDPLVREGLLRGYSKGVDVGSCVKRFRDKDMIKGDTPWDDPRRDKPKTHVFMAMEYDDWFENCLERVRQRCRRQDASSSKEVRLPRPKQATDPMQFISVVDLAQKKAKQWTSDARAAGQVVGKAMLEGLSNPHDRPIWKPFVPPHRGLGVGVGARVVIP